MNIKRGRPKHDPPLVAKHIRLTEDQWKLLRLWGRGDLSAGLRWLIEAAAIYVKRIEKKI